MDDELTYENCSGLVRLHYTTEVQYKMKLSSPVSFHLVKSITRYYCMNYEARECGDVHALVSQQIFQNMQKIVVIHLL